MNIATNDKQVKPNVTNNIILFYNTGVAIKYPLATNNATKHSNI